MGNKFWTMPVIIGSIALGCLVVLLIYYFMINKSAMSGSGSKKSKTSSKTSLSRSSSIKSKSTEDWDMKKAFKLKKN